MTDKSRVLALTFLSASLLAILISIFEFTLKVNIGCPVKNVLNSITPMRLSSTTCEYYDFSIITVFLFLFIFFFIFVRVFRLNIIDFLFLFLVVIAFYALFSAFYFIYLELGTAARLGRLISTQSFFGFVFLSFQPVLAMGAFYITTVNYLMLRGIWNG